MWIRKATELTALDRLVTRGKLVHVAIAQSTANGDGGGSIRALNEGKAQSNNGRKMHDGLKIGGICNQEERTEYSFFTTI